MYALAGSILAANATLFSFPAFLWSPRRRRRVRSYASDTIRGVFAPVLGLFATTPMVFYPRDSGGAV